MMRHSVRVLQATTWLALTLTTTALGAPSAASAPAKAAPPSGMEPTAPRPRHPPVALCQVHVIHATKQPGPFPKALRHMRSQLESRPFSAFRSFALLGVRSLGLASGERRRAPMVGPYVLEAELLSRVVSAKRPERLRFSLTLDRLADRQRPAKRVLRSVLVLDRGGTLFLAGPRHRQGTLVFGVTCR